jgi:hypothetical protein
MPTRRSCGQPEVARRRGQLVRQRLTERPLVEKVLLETRPYTRASGMPPPIDEQVQRCWQTCACGR